MSIIKKLLFAGFTFFAINANAQTADEIAAKNIEAMGGAAKLNTLNTVKMTGSINVRGMDLDMSITKSQMKGMRLDIEVMGTSYYQFANPDKGMMFMPGMGDATEMDAQTLKSFFGQADIRGAFLNYKDKGTTIEYQGKEKADSGDAYKMKVTFKDGRSGIYYIDTKSNLVVKTAAKVPVNGQEMDVESHFGDYHANSDGYIFPYSVSTPNGVISYSKIESNVRVDENIYKN